jgi:dTDP-glucose 4,6-dehydratase
MKSFVHIRDVVRGGLRAMRQGAPGSVYHFSVPSEQTIADVVRITAELMGQRFDDVAEPIEERLGQDARYVLDCTKAREELGWSPQVRFQDGVAETVEWIEDHWAAVQQEPHVYVHTV